MAKAGTFLAEPVRASSLALVCAVLAGCAALRTERLADGPNLGIVYYLPKGLTRVEVVEVRRPNAGAVRTLHVGETVYVPDLSRRCRLVDRPSVWSDDDVKVTLSAEGLLDSVQVTAHHRAADVVVHVARAAAAIAPAAVAEKTVLHSALVDIADPDAVTRFNAVLDDRYKGLRLAADPVPRETPAPDLEPISGVYYRPVRPVTVKSMADDGERVSVVLLPDPATVVSLPIDRRAFVKKVTHIEFDHGVLRKFTLRKPSEALAAASIPIEIGKALVSIPAELLQIRIDRSDKDRSLLLAEKKRIEAEEALRVLREKLAAAEDDPMGD